MRRFKKIKNNFIYLFIRLIIFTFNLPPRPVAIWMGTGLGYLASIIFRHDSQKADSHLRLAFGDKLDAKERKKIIRKMFANFGKNGADVIRLRKYYDREIRGLVKIEGLEHFDKAYRRGKGVIAVTGHLGNFELMAIHLANSGYKVGAIARELYDKRLNNLLENNREALNVRMVDTRESPRKIVRLLKEGYTIAVLIDTDSMRVRSIFVPAFGHLSNTPVGQSILGLRTGAAFVPMACVRVGNKYKLIIKPEVVINRTDDFDKDMYNVTKRCTEELEQIITEYKDQWIWIHNRWLTRPEKPIN